MGAEGAEVQGIRGICGNGAMSIIVRIREAYGTIEEDEIQALDEKQDEEDRA